MNPNKPAKVQKARWRLIILGTGWYLCVNYVLRDQKIGMFRWTLHPKFCLKLEADRTVKRIERSWLNYQTNTINQLIKWFAQ